MKKFMMVKECDGYLAVVRFNDEDARSGLEEDGWRDPTRAELFSQILGEAFANFLIPLAVGTVLFTVSPGGTEWFIVGCVLTMILSNM